jgi:hypothetical protein
MQIATKYISIVGCSIDEKKGQNTALGKYPLGQTTKSIEPYIKSDCSTSAIIEHITKS